MEKILCVAACMSVLVLATACKSTDDQDLSSPDSPTKQVHLRTILELWDFGDPVATELRLTEARDAARARSDEEFASELLTQIARARGLQRDFEGANALLDEVDAELESRRDGEFTTVRVRSLLERGRVLNTSGDAEASRPLFLEAWNLARTSGDDYLAVDAAHMLGIVAPEGERLAWNQVAIEYAETCGDEDARRWLASLYNNTAWTLHDGGDPEAALVLFERALAFRESEVESGGGDASRVFIARWSVARCLRSLGREDEALAMQWALAADLASAGAPPDGFVHEELGELLLLAGDDEAAREQFQLALPLLREIPWVGESDPARLERIEALARAE